MIECSSSYCRLLPVVLCLIQFSTVSSHAFGQGRPSQHVLVVNDKLNAKDFISKFVLGKKAALFKGLYTSSPAHKLWSDEYFLNLQDVPSDSMVLVESRKKENRKAPPVEMNFKEFVKIYNVTDQYMVESVPAFLRKDVQIPSALQCEELLDTALVETMMWFSSGGTKSVVHTDSVENLNCLIAGSKSFVIVPPQYKERVSIDHPNGAYSDIDVENVDYEKYPGLAEVEFLHANLEAGDCLYIPYKWIHQVNSFNRNIAVNFWWDVSKTASINLDQCNTDFHPDWSLLSQTTLGFADVDTSPLVIRDQLEDIVKQSPVQFDQFCNRFGILVVSDQDFIESEYYQPVLLLLKKSFEAVDTDSSQVLDREDLISAHPDVWNEVSSYVKEVGQLLEEYDRAREYGEDDVSDEDGDLDEDGYGQQEEFIKDEL